MLIRPAMAGDEAGLWAIIEPILRAGETYALPRSWSREEALAYWLAEGHAVYVAGDGGRMVGTYYLQANQRGGGDHVANCGYMVAGDATGRGIARTMCLHSLDEARARGFRAMQFNYVVASNSRAVALWHSLGFATVGTVPGAFQHPTLGFVDALVMHQAL